MGGRKRKRCACNLQVVDDEKKANRKLCRVAYVRQDMPKKVLIEYVGDDFVAAQYPHGNAVDVNRTYVRTQPHVINELRTSNGDSDSKVYQNMIVSLIRLACHEILNRYT